MNMKYENVKIMELCPLVFVCKKDLDNVSIKGLENKGRLLDFFKAIRVVNNFIINENLQNVYTDIYADCNIDNMVEIRGLDDPFNVMEVFKACKNTFSEVKLGVYLEGYINKINFVILDSENEFWARATFIWKQENK